ncbi:hypothetical protein ACHAW6_014304 [Cyclotella cf. meneghiniana]
MKSSPLCISSLAILVNLCCAIVLAFTPSPLRRRSYTGHDATSLSLDTIAATTQVVPLTWRRTCYRPQSRLSYRQTSDNCVHITDDKSMQHNILVEESHMERKIDEAILILAARTVDSRSGHSLCVGYLMQHDSNYEAHISTESLDRSAAMDNDDYEVLDQVTAVFHRLLLKYLAIEHEAYEEERDGHLSNKHTSIKIILSEIPMGILERLRDFGFSEVESSSLGLDLELYLPFLNQFIIRNRGTAQGNTALSVMKMLCQRRVSYRFTSKNDFVSRQSNVSLQEDILPSSAVESVIKIVDEIKAEKLLSTNLDSVDGLPSLHLNMISNGMPLFDAAEPSCDGEKEQVLTSFAQYICKLTEILRPHLYDNLLPSVRRLFNSSTVEISDVFVRNYGVLDDLHDNNNDNNNHEPKARFTLSPHYDITAYSTCVIALDSTSSTGKNGLYTIPRSKRINTNHAALRQFFPMRKGDGVVHTFDILHGVDVDPDLNRSRTSLIVWFADRKCKGSDARRVWLEDRSDDISQFVSGLASEVENGASAETLELYLSSASQGNIFALTALAQFCNDGTLPESEYRRIFGMIPPNPFRPNEEAASSSPTGEALANALWYHAAIVGGNRVAQNALAHNLMARYASAENELSADEKQDLLLISSVLFTLAYSQGYNCLESLEKLLEVECHRLHDLGIPIPSEEFFASPVIRVLMLSVTPSGQYCENSSLLSH